MTSVSPAAIRALLMDNGLLARDVEVDDAQSLIGAGALDSLRLIDVVATLEQRFGIKVADDDLTPENFDSIQSLSTYVSARLAAQS